LVVVAVDMETRRRLATFQVLVGRAAADGMPKALVALALLGKALLAAHQEHLPLMAVVAAVLAVLAVTLTTALAALVALEFLRQSMVRLRFVRVEDLRQIT
jgi:cytochrome c oxidase assembly factor CtaG